ncbi:MAG: hypothetical protein OXC40_06340 [Proteobacteria bacterium]|nr:hypothetical protein [Pseudomonadota bacterium]
MQMYTRDTLKGYMLWRALPILMATIFMASCGANKEAMEKEEKEACERMLMGTWNSERKACDISSTVNKDLTKVSKELVKRTFKK